MSEAPPDNRMPRAAVIVVAVGLLACVVAALLATDRASGEAAQLEWVQEGTIPDSSAATVAGGGGTMQLTDGGLKATGTNVSGYALFRASAVLRIDAGSPVGSGRIFCRVKGRNAFVAQTGNLRASYPRSSKKLFNQEVPEVVLVEYSSHGLGLAVLEFDDLFASGFSTERGVKLEWPPYEEGAERWEWFLPSGPPAEDLVLPFATVFKTTAIPAAKIACTLTTSAGETTVATAGALPERSPPIDEEAEEIAQEEAQESEEAEAPTEEAE
ncbi:MAG: hypothetical protein R2725_12775 [Solirubrobacterales bacterium]